MLLETQRSKIHCAYRGCQAAIRGDGRTGESEKEYYLNMNGRWMIDEYENEKTVENCKALGYSCHTDECFALFHLMF
jgi:hypothetical protein